MTTTQADVPAATKPKPASRRPIDIIRYPLVESSLTTVGFLMLFAAFGIWLGPLFLNIDARLLDIHQNVPVLLMAFAALVTLIAGQFDLSISGTATLVTFLCVGLASKQGVPFGMVIVICLAMGAIVGLVNGLLVVGLSINTFIATLGTGGVMLGISAVYSGGSQVVPGVDDAPIPTWFSTMGTFTEKVPAPLMVAALVAAIFAVFLSTARLGRSSWAPRSVLAARLGVVALIIVGLVAVDVRAFIDGISWSIAVLFVIAALLWILLRFTTYGRYLAASGSNPTAARLAGVKTRREIVKAFVVSGLLAAMAGLLLAANQGSASPDIAGPFLLSAFAAAFLSTVVLSRGHFTVWGAVVGGIFVVWVNQALIVGGVPPTWTGVVNGAVLILAVGMSSVMRRQST